MVAGRERNVRGVVELLERRTGGDDRQLGPDPGALQPAIERPGQSGGVVLRSRPIGVGWLVTGDLRRRRRRELKRDRSRCVELRGGLRRDLACNQVPLRLPRSRTHTAESSSHTAAWLADTLGDPTANALECASPAGAALICGSRPMTSVSPAPTSASTRDPGDSTIIRTTTSTNSLFILAQN